MTWLPKEKEYERNGLAPDTFSLHSMFARVLNNDVFEEATREDAEKTLAILRYYGASIAGHYFKVSELAKMFNAANELVAVERPKR